MSSKSSLFLTGDHNEHCYTDCFQPVEKNNVYLGDTITLEMSKDNIRIVSDDDDFLILEIDPGSELYDLIKMMRN